MSTARFLSHRVSTLTSFFASLALVMGVGTFTTTSAASAIGTHATSPTVSAQQESSGREENAHLIQPPLATTSDERQFATKVVVGKCATVSAARVGSAIGRSMYYRGDNLGPASFAAFGPPGHLYKVGTTALSVNMLSCNYADEPGAPSLVGFTGLGVSVTYAIVATPARAVSVTKWMCSSLSAFGSPTTIPGLGSASCVQGHAGAMQSSNAYAAVGDVVIQMFGSTSPAQSSALARMIAPLLLRAKWTTLVARTPPTHHPSVTNRTTAYGALNGIVRLSLQCNWGSCTGQAQLTEITPAGTSPVVVAGVAYSIKPSRAPTNVNMMVTSAGAAFFSATSVDPVQLELTITVGGGATLNGEVPVSFVSSSPPTSTTIPAG